jgi:hypothetical protein
VFSHDDDDDDDGRAPNCLFYSDALGQVSGLVDVAAAADGDVVGEELEGDDFEDGKQ